MNKESQFLQRIQHVALDMDGTIYLGDTLFDCTLPFLNELDRLGISYSFLTNNPTRSADDYVAKLARMGVGAKREQIYTSAAATVDFLKSRHPEWRKLFILGTASMTAEFEAAGYVSLPDSPQAEPDAVIVAFDMSLSYDRLCRASWWIKRGAPYVATNPDRYCPTDRPTVLVDCGAICAAIEAATGRRPDTVVGKPNPEILRSWADRVGVPVENIAMVGDRLTTDVQTAHNAGAVGVLVLSGETSAEEAAAADPQPHITVDNIGSLGRLLAESRKRS